ncbi:putative peptidyl-tRNA hydrolase PTRHD1 [Vitis vinifera]|uniref:peptidyl-tRNA hydrolase n=1 Tax=Vitis vinifera TaxID=29760 RepID=A0A438K8F6_VITVI|nr:putative peptidyl-tRNA hydrolase PTRHD1 [Vitis vinifera]
MVSDPNIFPSPHMVTGFSLRPVTSSISHFPPKHRVRFRVSESLSFPIRTPSRLSSKQMSTESAADSNAIVSSDGKAANPDILVQYVVLQRDLIEKWPLGSIVTQGCHASVCAIWAYKDDPHTIEYCSPENIDSMHKVTLEVKGETQMENLVEKLRAGGIAHKLWIEQPENIPTCLATKPYPKSIVSPFFRKLKLCKS